MKDKLRVLKVLKLISSESIISVRRLDILVRTKFTEIDSESLGLEVHLPELLKSMLEEGLIDKNEGYSINDIGLKFFEDNFQE